MDDPLVAKLREESAKRKRLERKEWTRAEALEHLRGWPKDFPTGMEALLNLPEKLYRAPGNGFELNGKEGASNAGLVLRAFRGDDAGALKQISTYSLGFIGDGSHTYFFLTDPSRKLAIFERVGLAMEDISSWQGVERKLRAALNK